MCLTGLTFNRGVHFFLALPFALILLLPSNPEVVGMELTGDSPLIHYSRHPSNSRLVSCHTATCKDPCDDSGPSWILQGNPI